MQRQGPELSLRQQTGDLLVGLHARDRPLSQACRKPLQSDRGRSCCRPHPVCTGFIPCFRSKSITLNSSRESTMHTQRCLHVEPPTSSELAEVFVLEVEVSVQQNVLLRRFCSCRVDATVKTSSVASASNRNRLVSVGVGLLPLGTLRVDHWF